MFLLLNNKLKNEEDMKDEIGNSNSSDSEDSFIFDDEFINYLNKPKLNIKNTNKFPYCAIGIIMVKFPVTEDLFIYTCFLIEANAVVTLACNLESKAKGGKATYIKTSFSKEEVKWENVYFLSCYFI